MTTKINTGDIRDLATMECIGWTRHGEPIEVCPDGYNHQHYWDADGRYLGPDEDGIEPVYDAEPETCTFSGGSTGTITRDHSTYRGVVLDRCDVTGPRGGKSVLWRAAARRLHPVATWCNTRDEAARVAPGYTG